MCLKWHAKFGALAQLVERTTSCASPAPTPQVGELAQKINTKFGALAQLVERTNRTLTPTPISNQIRGISTVGSAQHSHCWGQGFDSPMLHFKPVWKDWFFLYFQGFAAFCNLREPWKCGGIASLNFVLFHRTNELMTSKYEPALRSAATCFWRDYEVNCSVA